MIAIAQQSSIILCEKDMVYLPEPRKSLLAVRARQSGQGTLVEPVFNTFRMKNMETVKLCNGRVRVTLKYVILAY